MMFKLCTLKHSIITFKVAKELPNMYYQVSYGRVGIKRGTWNGMERWNGIWNGTPIGKKNLKDT